MANKIQIKRGAYGDLPTLLAGELGFSTDTKQLHIGDGSANYEVVMHQLFDATTFLYATADNTPEAKTPAQTMGILSGTAAANFSMNSKLLTDGISPVLPTDYTIKSYVDSVSIGLDFKESVRAATTTTLPTCTPSGTGVGKTLTADAVGVLTLDGVATVLGDRVLVKNQAAADDNGIYTVTTEGTAGVAFVLTRAIDFDQTSNVSAGAFMFITEGTTLADQGWVLTTNDPITIDTTNLTFTQFSSAGSVVAHKDTHDPEDGSDPLDTAAAAEISVVVAAGIGSSHSFSRADHVHAINHGISDNHIVTIDSASVATGEYAKFTANGLESRTVSEVVGDLPITYISLTDTSNDWTTLEAATGTGYLAAISSTGDKLAWIDTIDGGTFL